MPHKEKGEIPVAAVEVHDGSVVNEGELLEWCRQNLAAYKAPRRIWILEANGLPQNHSGKMLRRVLQERFSQEMY
jgi:acyl-CoA synthetase (AMP-forming)/AMP-acid ligase II